MENEILESIANHLGFKSDDKTFCTSIITSSETLKLSVNEIGEIEFPLSPKAVKKLTKIATPALFGWKEQTIYDPAVRDVWEISKNEVQFLNSRWEQTLNQSLKKSIAV